MWMAKVQILSGMRQNTYQQNEDFAESEVLIIN